MNNNTENKTVADNVTNNNTVTGNVTNNSAVNNVNANVSRYKQYMQKKKQESAKRFTALGLPSLIFALVYAVCIYRCLEGVFNVFAAIAIVVYITYVSKKFEKKIGAFVIFIFACIILLSISNCLTGNYAIIFFDYVAIIALILIAGIYIFIDVNKVMATKQMAMMIVVPVMAIEKMINAIEDIFYNTDKLKIKKNKKVAYALLGICITIPFFILICVLLMSADEVFDSFFKSIFGSLHLWNVVFNIIGIVIVFILAYVSSYGIAADFSERKYDWKKGKIKEFEPIVAIIFTSAISFLYIIFSFIQVRYLFLGNGKLPNNYTYAEYAREGFFQLLFVCIFNMIIVLICNEFFKKSIILKIINMILCICTLIMIGSSAYRMKMYIAEYGLTFTRVLVLWALIVMTVLMLGLVKQLLCIEFNLFKYSVIVISVLYVILSFSHPDYYIAQYDLEMYEHMEKSGFKYVDYEYINDLSTDAALAVKNHREAVFGHIKNVKKNIRKCEWAYIYRKDGDGEHNRIGIRNFNVSQFIAQNEFQKYYKK